MRNVFLVFLIFIFAENSGLSSSYHCYIREGLGLCAGYPLEVEAGLMVAVTIIACFTLLAELPLLLTAIGACQRIARKNKKGIDQSQA